MDQKVVVIGSGPCGLGAAWRLSELKHDNWVVLEKDERPGGLASSVIDDNGFLFDLGVHQIYSHYSYFDKAVFSSLSEEHWFNYVRFAGIRMKQRYIPYPFQYNIRHLPPEDVLSALNGLVDLQTQEKRPPSSFEDWLLQSFGRGLCELFMFPYNKKNWATPLDQISCGWMGERVATVSLKRLLENIVFQKDDIGWGPNATFHYPKHGGSGAVWEAIYNHICRQENTRDPNPPEKGCSRFKFNSEVKSINTSNKTIELTNGELIKYDQLISALPADVLLRMLVDKPDLHPLANQFHYSSVHLFGFGMEGPVPKEIEKMFWIYAPEECYPFHRITVMSNYSCNNVPKPGQQWSLLVEWSESPHRPREKTTEQMKDEILQGLLDCGILPQGSQVISRWYHRLQHAYPTPFYHRAKVLDEFHGHMKKLDIRSRGRFGGWKYEVSNQDHSFMQGVEAVDAIIYNSEEVTYFTPAVIESGQKLTALPSAAITSK